MKYLKSTTQKTYLFNGKYIPAAVTKENNFLQMTNGEFDAFQQNPVVKSLMNAGAIFVTDVAPTRPEDQLKSATQDNARLILENTRLQDELRKAKEATGSTEVESLKAALAKQIADDTAEITALRDEKDETIRLLEAKLAAATAASKTAAKAAESVESVESAVEGSQE